MARRVSKTSMRETELQKLVLSMEGGFTAYQVFTDWIECVALSIANSLKFFHDAVWENRENQYKQIISKYNKNETEKFGEMLALLIDELERDPRDVLGEVFMKSGMGSDSGG